MTNLESGTLQFPQPRKLPSDLGAQVAYLKDQDDPLRWEAPRMFNRCAELRRFERFVSDLEGRLDRKLDYALGGGVDEAPFHGELFFGVASIRASNFGRMLTVLFSDNVPAAVLRVIGQVASEHGYVLIEETLIAEPYCASRGIESSTETWGSRFFGCASRH